MTNKKTNPLHILFRIKNAVTRKGLLKLACLVLAFATWQTVRENTSFEVVVADVPVHIVGGDGLAVLSQSAAAVNVRFRGAREDVRFISQDQVSVSVDLSGKPDRLRQTVKFAPRHVKAPSRAQAVQFDPPELTVVLDREVEAVLPVKAALEGRLPEGVSLERAVCTPASVRVRGAEQLVRDLEQVLTRPIHLDGRYGTFQTQVPLAMEGRGLTASPDRVSVELQLAEQIATKRFSGSRIRTLLPPDIELAVRVRPETVNFVLSGSPRRIQQLNEDTVYPYIDCTDLTESADYEVSVRIHTPPGVRADEIDPSVVYVNIRKL